MITRAHGDFCPQPYRGECVQFSTDGSRLGIDIAHTFGTMDEDEIIHDEVHGVGDPNRFLTGMTEEQREWEGLDEEAQCSF